MFLFLELEVREEWEWVQEWLVKKDSIFTVIGGIQVRDSGNGITNLSQVICGLIMDFIVSYSNEFEFEFEWLKKELRGKEKWEWEKEIGVSKSVWRAYLVSIGVDVSPWKMYFL